MRPQPADDLCYICGVAEKQFYSQEGYCVNCEAIMDAAEAAIRQARQDGVPIYGPETWREANMEHRLEHAATHIYQYKRGERDEDHLAHAICDLVFVYATKP